MMHWQIYCAGLMAISLFALAGWVLSLARDNVTHVDSMWSLMVGMSAYAYALFFYDLHPRTLLVLVLVTLWALRLCGYLTCRSWSLNEDRHYAMLRKKHQPFFWFTSIYIIFGSRALLAWLISMSLFGAMQQPGLLYWLDYLGATLVLFGFLWESIADAQLARFKADDKNEYQVLSKGLWRYSRHPNYFGECCVWWGFYSVALAAGAWWSVISPLLMTFILLKFNGVARLEKDIHQRRPAYTSYQQNTSAFLPTFFRIRVKNQTK